jgi:hypothetical protein
MPRITRRRVAIACLATFASLLLVPQPGPASAAPTWLTPGNVLSDPTRDAADVHVAVSPGGHTLVVWREQVGATYAVRMTERRPGGVWTAPVQLWSGPLLAFTLHAVVNDAGAAAVAFTTAANGKARVRATVRSSYTADWPATDGMGADPWDTTDPDLAMGPGGEAVLAYVVDTGPDTRIGVASGTDFASWEEQLLTGSLTVVGGPQVAIDAAGSPTVAWNRVVGGQTAASTSSRLPDGSWSSPAPQAIGSSELCDLVTSGKGDVVILWRRFDGQTYRFFLRTRTSGAWGPAIQIADDVASPSQLHLAVDPAGRGTVTFLSWNGVGFETLVMSQETDGHWSGPLNLSTPGTSALTPDVVVDGAGVVTVVWVATNGSSASLLARTRPPGGAWGPTATIGPAHVSIYANGSAAADRSGNVLVAWEAPGTHTVGRLAVLDAAGPDLGDPTLPTPAYAGRRAALSLAQPVDTWSQIAQVAWGFGDGGSAAGLTAEHTWRKRGSYPVVVTATDAVGNSTTTSTVITVIGRPRLSKLRLLRPHLHPGSGPDSRTRLSFRLDTRAAVRATVRRPGGRVLVVLARKKLAAGRHVLALRTMMKGVRLPVGTYRVTLVASNPAGKGKPRTVALTVSRG